MAARRQQDRDRLPVVETELARLELQISRLRIERSGIKRRLESYIYPVQNLPNEIVSEIFINLIPPYPECPPLFGQQSPTRLLRICHAWREIALHTPQLWRAIDCQGPPPRYRLRPNQTVPDAATTLAEINTWLGRSASCGLSLSFDPQPDENPEYQTDVMKLLRLHQHRWEFLTMTSVAAVESNETPLALAGPLPLLRELWAFHSVAVSAAPSNAPMLRSLFLSIPRFPDTFAMGPNNIQWAQFTSLNLNHAIEDCLPILRDAVNLRHFYVHLEREKTILPAALHLPPRLETFILVFDANPGSLPLAPGYLQKIVGPALKRVHIHAVFLQPNPMDVINAFLRNSQCPLQHLQFMGQSKPFVILAEELRVLLPHIPKITKVSGPPEPVIGQSMDQYFDRITLPY
ncbi:F-box domain-containing protein [Mycena indigotica]|uniref:F-box domain-containing protein n=1 Tax=Mycena indigotica TaxID=2126181 RepID=A0A8H6SC92_9AGAR|nr:F-box domain-containing protein [Mycena indigotica]KAF7295677.1 F-box domain-containing protein [Mycena indigotica]